MSPSQHNRRQFFAGAAASVAGLAVARSALAGLPEPVIQTSVDTAPPLVPSLQQFVLHYLFE